VGTCEQKPVLGSSKARRSLQFGSEGGAEIMLRKKMTSSHPESAWLISS
jgi:hypothetical protein